jgi:HSP20 family protein
MAKIERGHHFLSGFGNEDYLEDYFTNRGFRGRPAANFSEKEDAYRIELGVPGLCRDDVNIQVSGNELTVEGDGQTVPDEEAQTYSRQEFEQRRFKRTFRLPDNSDTDRISARCKEGLLVIDVPKSETSKRSRRITIG